MTSSHPTLHIFCGKIAAGKSTLAAQLARQPGTLLIAEDRWLAALFADQLRTGADYLRCSGRLQSIMAPHVAALLDSGLSVVLDFAANTRQQRKWLRSLASRSGLRHQMHVLLPPDAVCLERLRSRNASGDHPFAATEAQFHQFAKHFQPPAADEGFDLVYHNQPG